MCYFLVLKLFSILAGYNHKYSALVIRMGEKIVYSELY